MKPTLLVLAAGMGSRYGGLKQMDGLGPNGETIIDYSIHDAVQAGFGKVVYIVREYFLGQFKETVRKKYSNVRCSDGSPLEFVFVTQELNKIPARFTLNPERQKPWGTAHAVLMAKDVIDGPFVVINGDDYYGKESFRIAGDWCRAHENGSGVYAIVGFELDHTLSESGGVSRGICHYDAEKHLTDVVEHLNIIKDGDGVVSGDNSVTSEHVVHNGSSPPPRTGSALPTRRTVRPWWPNSRSSRLKAYILLPSTNRSWLTLEKAGGNAAISNSSRPTAGSCPARDRCSCCC